MPSTALRVTVLDLYFRSLPRLSQSSGPVAHALSAAVLLRRGLGDFYFSVLLKRQTWDSGELVDLRADMEVRYVEYGVHRGVFYHISRLRGARGIMI